MKIDKNFDHDLEKAIKFLVLAIHKSGHNPKPVILHSIRMGLYLKNLGYDRKICQAAILHDVIEDTDMKIERVQKQFGQDIAKIVQANSFDKGITDEDNHYKEIFNNSLKIGKDALIVRASDILDNSYYYHLAERKDKIQWLHDKMKYFLDLSGDVIRNERVFQDLQKQYLKLVRI